MAWRASRGMAVRVCALICAASHLRSRYSATRTTPFSPDVVQGVPPYAATDASDYASISFTTFPWMSVSRKSRPWKR